MSTPSQALEQARRRGLLKWIERVGNRLPDPAALFVLCLVMTWILSAVLAPIEFTEVDPRTYRQDELGHPLPGQPIKVESQLTGRALVAHLSGMVRAFTSFPPLGVVLVALLGMGVAEHVGLVN